MHNEYSKSNMRPII